MDREGPDQIADVQDLGIYAMNDIRALFHMWLILLCDKSVLQKEITFEDGNIIPII